ncbi:MAG: hypothetical protein JNK49_20865 [Planctomycetes bacterium]|nr:hypothetical protein [Planctomycetota bacterium]
MSDSATIPVAKPRWYHPTGLTRQETASVAPADENAQRVQVADSEDGAVGLMTPPATLASALMQAEVPMRFEASAFLVAHLSEEVALEMVDAASGLYQLHNSRRRMGSAPDSQSAERDVFFAMWPDLPGLIANKCVAIDVHRANRKPGCLHRGQVSFHKNVSYRDLRFTFHMPNWAVTVFVTGKENKACLGAHQELVDEVFRLTRLEMEKQR